MPYPLTPSRSRDVVPAAPRSFLGSLCLLTVVAVLCSVGFVGVNREEPGVEQQLTLQTAIVAQHFANMVGTPAVSMQNWAPKKMDGGDQPRWKDTTSDVRWVKLDAPTFLQAATGGYNGWGLWALSEKNQAVSLRLSVQAAHRPLHREGLRQGLVTGSGYRPTVMDVESTTTNVSVVKGADGSVVISTPPVANDQVKLWAWVQDARQEGDTWVAHVRVGRASNTDALAAQKADEALNASLHRSLVLKISELALGFIVGLCTLEILSRIGCRVREIWVPRWRALIAKKDQ